MTRSERIYRALLLAYPERTRLILGEDMVQLFRDRLRDASSPAERAAVWFEAITDLAVTAPKEHLARRSVRKIVEGPEPEAARPLGPDIAWAAAPLLLAVLLPLALPHFYAPLFDPRVSILGLPAGVAMLSLATVLASFGVLEARRLDFRHPDVRAGALAVLLTLLLPIIVLGVMALQPIGWLIYAVVMAVCVEAARFRAVMLALGIPFVLVLMIGPALILIVINLRV